MQLVRWALLPRVFSDFGHNACQKVAREPRTPSGLKAMDIKLLRFSTAFSASLNLQGRISHPILAFPPSWFERCEMPNDCEPDRAPWVPVNLIKSEINKQSEGGEPGTFPSLPRVRNRLN